MSLLKSFKGFISRVLNTVRGKLSRADVLLLEHLLMRTRERNLVLARGLLSALKMQSPNKRDIQNLAQILDNANIRIIKKKDPFTENEKNVLSNIFARYGLSPKVADWITSQKDVFLYHEISKLSNKKAIFVPKFKQISINKKKKRKLTS